MVTFSTMRTGFALRLKFNGIAPMLLSLPAVDEEVYGSPSPVMSFVISRSYDRSFRLAGSRTEVSAALYANAAGNAPVMLRSLTCVRSRSPDPIALTKMISEDEPPGD